MSPRAACLFIALWLAAIPWAHGQELAPRSWAHLPIDTNFLGLGYAHTTGDIAFDPVLRIEGASVELDTWVARYIRSFQAFGRSARFDFWTGLQQGRWSGLLNGQPTSVSRSGPTDSVLRLAINLYGTPPLRGKAYADYRATTRNETIVGAAISLVVPTGEYFADKLINLGSNRYTLRPQLGFVRTLGHWSVEVSGAAWISTRNDNFFNGNTLEQDPLYTFQGHLTYDLTPGHFITGSLGGGFGARSRINGVEKDDRKENLVFSLTYGYPLSRRLGLKASYVGVRAQPSIGADTDTLLVALTTFW